MLENDSFFTRIGVRFYNLESVFSYEQGCFRDYNLLKGPFFTMENTDHIFYLTSLY